MVLVPKKALDWLFGEGPDERVYPVLPKYLKAPKP